MEADPNQKQEAVRLKAVAETKYTNSNLKSALKHANKAHKLFPDLDGLSSMLTAFKILRSASKPHSDITDWYKILQVEPFSHINTIKKQYKKLALVLHPDKNSYLGCEEAFKLVGEGFRVLSDKIRRKEYDMRLRIRLQEERMNENSVVETFWTACSRCRLLHQFERKYSGHNLMCPSCKKTFLAVEVKEEEEDSDVGETIREWSERLRNKRNEESGRAVENDETLMSLKLNKKKGNFEELGCGRLRSGSLRRKLSNVDEILEESKPVKTTAEEDMTLAQMQKVVKQKALQEKEKLKEKEKEEDERRKLVENEDHEKLCDLKKLANLKKKKKIVLEKSEALEIAVGGNLDKRRKLTNDSEGCGTSKNGLILRFDRRRRLKSRDLEMKEVEDSKLYDFDRDRSEISFKKGQVWAIYGDERLPRRYGLIDEVVSVNPFVAELIWLNLQSNGDEGVKTGFYASCGRFKVSRTTRIKSLGIFSHVIDCERAAREVYWIYPKKGSVWAIRDKKSYEIVVILTTYSEMHGLSMAYLEKVDGFSSVFKRREVGCHAIRLLGKDDIRLLSHQIPARKLAGDEISALLKDCWELDPASIPQHVQTDD